MPGTGLGEKGQQWLMGQSSSGGDENALKETAVRVTLSGNLLKSTELRSDFKGVNLQE